MDISVFLTQSKFKESLPENMHGQQLVHHVSFFTGEPEELEGKKIAIIGVCEDRAGLNNQGSLHGPDEFRKYFYQLFITDEPIGIIDLGNIEAGNQISDTYYALNQTCQVLLRKNIIPVIIGGSQDLTYANYLAYENMEQTVNLVTMDYKLDFGNSDNDITSKSYLNKIVLHKPNYLFNYANIGHQRYMVEPELLTLMTNMYFDVHRLGDVQSSLMKAEPALRNADILSIDIGCIRQGESPGCAYTSPNGFYGEEAAQLCWYAGMSDKLTSFGVYELNPTFDSDGQSAHLVAQLVWCFIDGVSQRKKDYPVGDYEEYMKFIVPLMQDGHELVFYKSPKTDRWWMDVPYPGGMENKYERHHLVPCTYDEYQQASHDEMPDRWWKTYQKLV